MSKPTTTYIVTTNTGYKIRIKTARKNIKGVFFCYSTCQKGWVYHLTTKDAATECRKAANIKGRDWLEQWHVGTLKEV